MRKVSKLTGVLFLACVMGFFAGVSVQGAEIFVYPCPWAPEADKTATGNLADGITFGNLPLEGELLIYTLDGALVKRANFSSATQKFQWFGKNDGGQDVASGVYFWVVKSGDSTKTGKLIVIR